MNMKMKRYGVNVRKTAIQPQEKQRDLTNQEVWQQGWNKSVTIKSTIISSTLAKYFFVCNVKFTKAKVNGHIVKKMQALIHFAIYVK